MLKSQAKQLKVGDVVLWVNESSVGGPHIGGYVTKKLYNTIWIKWNDTGEVKKHFAETMDRVFTADQIRRDEENSRVVEKIKAMTPEQRGPKL